MNGLERRLLATSLSSLPSKEGLTVGDSSLEDTLTAIEEGRYLDALRTPGSVSLLAPPSSSSAPAADEYYRSLSQRSSAAWSASSSNPSQASQALLTGVAALYAFAQTNLTGPVWKGPLNPWEVATWSEPPAAPHVPGTALPPRPKETEEDRWARKQLEEDGEDIVGRHDHVQYLLVARTLLAAPFLEKGDSDAYAMGQAAALSPLAAAAFALHPTLPIWAFRALLIQQRMLDGHSMTLRAQLKAFAPLMAGLKRKFPGEVRGPIAAALQVEISLMEHSYTYVDVAKAHLEASCRESDFAFEVTGKMGLRTKHQVEAKPQLIVQAHARMNADDAELSGDEEPSLWVVEAPPTETASLEGHEGQVDVVQQEIRGIVDESDVLVLPKMADGSLPAMLGSAEQAVLLGYSVHVKKGTAADDLQPWEMAPFVEAVLAQPRTRFLLHLAARLFRARHERTRNRTRERSLLTMEQLGEAVIGPKGPATHVRMHYAFSVWFPLLPALRKEIGEVMLGMGLVGAAMDIFERLELWDNLIVCYRLLGKKVQAEDLVQKRLLEEPNEAKLWCALGDLTLNEEHYVTAWERSGHRSARAQRSLAYAAHRKGEFERSAGHWELALAINPLNPNGWFSMGHCYIKTQSYEKALRAFTRSCQLEYDNGESWNNLAAVLMQMRRFKEGFNALGEAIKYKRDSWQTWENYAQCAVEARQFQQSCRSLIRVLEITQNSRLHVESLQKLAANYERLYLAVQEEKKAASAGENGAATPSTSAEPVPAPTSTSGVDAAFDAFDLPTEMNLESDEDEEAAGGATLNAAEALSRAVAGEEEGLDARGRARLLESFGSLLLEVFKRGANGMSGNSDLWEAFGRYYRVRGEVLSEKECQLKRVRGLQGGKWLETEESFNVFAAASLDLCRCYVRLAEGEEGRKSELAAARMHLRSVLKQAEEKYSETEGYGEMKRVLEQVVELENKASPST